MRSQLKKFLISDSATMGDALKQIDMNQHGFVVVVDKENHLCGVLTDGDIRRAVMKGFGPEDSILKFYTASSKKVCLSDSFETVCELFKNQSIKFLPIVDSENRLENIITKSQMHALLLQDIHADLSYDFFSIDTGVLDSEIYQRPWGFYKTTVLNDYYQAKIISVRPKEKLSLQSHNRREEHWVVVHGNGFVQLDDSVIPVTCGSSVFIPKGSKHRLVNTDETESLIVNEVQIGDYLGEDDIVRYEDEYGRL